VAGRQTGWCRGDRSDAALARASSDAGEFVAVGTASRASEDAGVAFGGTYVMLRRFAQEFSCKRLTLTTSRSVRLPA